MNIVINNHHYTLSPSDVIGSGGEGTVFILKGKANLAVKIYHTPTRERAEKVKYFLAQSPTLPNVVCAPIALVHDRNTSHTIGIAMPLLPRTAREINVLSSLKLRSALQFNEQNIARLLRDGVENLNHIHSHGLIVGDLSDLNLLYDQNRLYWIDVDAWQIGRFACTVATENFLDPNLYGIDLARAPRFTANNDWYSMAVLLFKSLLCTHPYGGTHPSQKTVTARAAHRTTVLDPGVVYPRVALPPEILTPEMMEIFFNIFKYGKRTSLPKELLDDYIDLTTVCPKCHHAYPGHLPRCPVCSERTKLSAPGKVDIRSKNGIQAKRLFQTSGNILAVSPQNGSLRIVYEQSGKILYTDTQYPPVEICRWGSGDRYAILGDSRVVVARAGSDELMLYELEHTRARLITRTTSGYFSLSRKPQFRTSPTRLFRIASTSLMVGIVSHGELIERALKAVIENQTWFTVDHLSDEPRIFGFFNLFSQQKYWAFEKSRHLELDVPQLEARESLTDFSVRFAPDSYLLQRLTQKRGENYLRTDVFSTTGSGLYSHTAKTEPDQTPIHGCLFAHMTILRPTDSGIRQEKLETGALKLFTNSAKHVTSESQLMYSSHGILVANVGDITHLTLT